MNEKTFNINSELGEVTIREGKALDLKPPFKLDVKGIISTPLHYIGKRHDTISPERAVILVDYQNRTIMLLQDQYNQDSPVVVGAIELDPDLIQWGINTSTTRSSVDLAILVRSNRLQFESIQQANELVRVFQNFNAKVQNTLRDSRDNKGNMTKSQEQIVVAMSIPEEFVLFTPIIKNGPKIKVLVEIIIHPDTLEIQLISPTINEIMKSQCGGMIDEQINSIFLIEPSIPILYI